MLTPPPTPLCRTFILTKILKTLSEKNLLRSWMVRSTPPPRSGAGGKFFTSKAYLHAPFYEQKMRVHSRTFLLDFILITITSL